MKASFDCLRTASHDIGIEIRNAPSFPSQLSDVTDSCTSTASRSPEMNNSGLDSEAAFTPVQVLNSDINGYGFTIHQVGENEYEMAANWRFDTQTVLNDFIEKNQALLHEATSSPSSPAQMMAAITFAQPASYQLASSLQATHKLNVLQYGVFGKSAMGNTVSSYYMQDDGRVHDWVSELRSDAELITFDGLMTMLVIVDSKELAELNQRPDVALIDLTANVAKAKLAREISIDIPLKDLYVPNPAWMLYEDTGSVPTAVGLKDTALATTMFSPTLSLLIVLVGAMLFITSIGLLRGRKA